MDEEPAEVAPPPVEERLAAAAERAHRRAWAVARARALRRLLPGDSSYGEDPLSTAGTEARQALARRIVELDPERPSVSRELALGALQVWQAASEAQGRGRGTDEVAIVFTDLVAFSAWALEVSDDAAIALLRAVSTAVEGAVIAHGGAVVKRMGDGLMATFRHAPDAVAAAFAAHAALGEIELSGYRPRMRVGIHIGRPRRVGGDYLGVDVNIAARVAEAARGDEVLVSQAVLDRLDPATVSARRRRFFRAAGAPRDLGVHAIERTEADG